MPPKSKAAPKAKEIKERTVEDRSKDHYYESRPYARAIDTDGVSGLSPDSLTAWACSKLLNAASASSPARNGRHLLSTKEQKELWRLINEDSLPLRCLNQSAAAPSGAAQPPLPGAKPSPGGTWGRDRSGRYVGEYTLDDFQLRAEKRARLTSLEVAHHAFLAKRAAGHASEQDPADEKQRRADIAVIRMELYGQRTGGMYAQDPEWDDVEPIALVEPEGALAAIAYPEVYSEAISYLRAVMTKPEYSARALRLTEHIITLNPAHYTVWLYRFSIVKALKIAVEDETAWLNKVALKNLKNYQIWHHRFLLAECYYPQIADSPERVADFARSEMDFLTTILAEDTKNYHVWSYRQYLVRKLGYWTDAERVSMEAFIRQDVRNNSAWSHRFFLVFSDPKQSSNVPSAADGADKTLEARVGELNISHDPQVPSVIVDREIGYAQEQITKAPQNESPWNYLRGVLTKGGRSLATMEEFALQFVSNIGSSATDADTVENVTSTHAMDMLAGVYAETGDKAKAALYLDRLSDKWDPIRAGYWRYRMQQLV